MIEPEKPSLATTPIKNDRYTSSNYPDAARPSKWRESTLAEYVQYVYQNKKHWTGKVVKWKSRLVILECSQIEGINYTDTFAPRTQQLSD